MSTEKCWTERIIEKEFDPEKMDELTKSALQYYSSRIGKAISPVNVLDMPFIIAALKLVVNAFAAENPSVAVVADMLMQNFKAVPAKTRVPDGLSREEFEQFIDQIYGQSRKEK